MSKLYSVSDYQVHVLAKEQEKRRRRRLRHSCRIGGRMKASVSTASWALQLAVLATGCTTVNVTPVDATKYPMSLVCIEENPKVAVGDFLGVVESEFAHRGIATEVYSRNLPEHCEYTLRYTARRSWDLATYMASAELRLKQAGRTIGSATYSHAGGFGFNKWASTRSKMRPVIDELLANFRATANRH